MDWSPDERKWKVFYFASLEQHLQVCMHVYMCVRDCVWVIVCVYACLKLYWNPKEASVRCQEIDFGKDPG